MARYSSKRNAKAAATTASSNQTQQIADLETTPDANTDAATGTLTSGVIKRRYEQARRAVQFDTREYWANKSFVEGQQWIKWDNHNERYVAWRRQGNRVQTTINKMDNLVASYLGRAIKVDLVFEVPPATADDYAIEGALVGAAVINYKHDTASWEDKRDQLAIAALYGGTSALATEWDPNAKAFGSVNTGDTKETVLNITEFAVEPNAKEARRARWWVKAQVLPPEEVRACYQLDYTPKPDASVGGPFSGGLMGSPSNNSEATKGTRVITYYERPNFLRKQGAIAVMVNDKIVWGPKPWPFPFKDHLNIEVVRETIVDAQWNGLTRLTKTRPIQVQYNFVHSNIQDHIRKVGTAKPIAPYGTAEVFDQWNDDPASPLLYPDGAQAPGYLVPPVLPTYILQQLDRLEADMQDAMGVHDISQGQAPANIESGFGLQTLQENDANPSTAFAKRLARAFANTASSDLEMYAANVKDTRTATVYQQNSNLAESVTWSGKTLAGQTHVIIPADAVIPQSKAAAQQFAQTLAGMPGYLPPGQEGLTMLLELAQIPNRDDLLWYANPDEARARHDVARIMQGEVVVPKEFQNHNTAITVANRARLSPRYDTLTTKIKNALDLYVRAQQALAEEQSGQQLKRAAMSPALANTPTANAAAPLPAELSGVAPNQPAALPGPGIAPSSSAPEPQVPSPTPPQGDINNG